MPPVGGTRRFLKLPGTLFDDTRERISTMYKAKASQACELAPIDLGEK
jgi:hypothetical protein